ncbi:hypothetical protein BX666DRAFT_1280241 [Dichotomocladium elegans]|nr:hypothetical protein BX666DRAFT_1280241 [Dichotomocladium elegans]
MPLCSAIKQQDDQSSSSTEKRIARRVPPPPERMVTRGVSGAIRHKSVGEILSGLDHNNISMTEPRKEKRTPPAMQTETGGLTTKTKRPTQQRAAVALAVARRPDAQYYPPQTYNGVKLHDLLSQKEGQFDLFAWYLHANAQPLYKAIQTAQRIVTTRDWTLAWDELRSIKAVQKIEDLKKKNLWSLRQPKRHKASPRSKTHWDILLDEMKWMRTDFKEERKWKVAMAYTISRAVMEWHWTEDKSSVCVKTRIPPPRLTLQQELDEQNSSNPHHFHSAPSPDTLQDEQMPLIKTEDFDSISQPTLPTPPQQLLVADLEPVGTPVDLPSVPCEEDNDATLVAAAQAAIQAYRSAILALDPNIPIFSFPLEGPPLDINILFPDLLAFEPPNPVHDDVYFNELEYGRINPISSLSTKKMILKKSGIRSAAAAIPYLSRKRKIDGEQINICPFMDQDNQRLAPRLPRNERYDMSPQTSSIFTPRKIRDIPASQPRAPHQPDMPRSSATGWTEDDDLCLISLILQYGFNWDLITDAFNSIRGSITGTTRASWECYERWKQNNLTTVSGQVSQGHIAKLKKEATRRQNLRKFDTAKRRQRQYNVFEAIKRSQKKREEAQKATTSAPAPRSAVETHGMNASGQRLPTAMELSIHKAQRDRQMTQMLWDQRQLTAAYGLGDVTATTTSCDAATAK